MALLEDLGRSGALREVTSDLRSLISQRRAEKRQEGLDVRQEEREAIDLGFRERAEGRAITQHESQTEGRAVATEISRVKLQSIRQEEDRQNTWEPIDVIRAKLPGVTDTAWSRMLSVAGDRVTTDGGAPGMTVRDQGEAMAEMMSNLEMHKLLDIDTLVDLNQAKLAIKQELSNPKLKTERIQELQQQLANINMGISAIATRQKPLDLAIQRQLAEESRPEDTEKRVVAIDKNITSLERARFNAVNKGQGQNDILSLMASITGEPMPDVGKPEGLDRYLSFIDQQLEDLKNEKINLSSTGVESETGETIIPESSHGKLLTRSEAVNILNEAGGDPSVAERIAKERGFRF